MNPKWNEPCPYGWAAHDFAPTHLPANGTRIGPIIAVCRKCGALR